MGRLTCLRKFKFIREKKKKATNAIRKEINCARKKATLTENKVVRLIVTNTNAGVSNHQSTAKRERIMKS